MERFFNRATSLMGVRRLAHQHGHDVHEAMAAVGLSNDLFRTPEQRVSFSRLCALLEYCADTWTIPDFGLQLAQYQHLEILGPVALVTKMERDVRSAMTAILENLVLHTNATIVALQEEGDIATLTLDAIPIEADTRQYVMLSVGVARNLLEQTAKRSVKLIEVSFLGEDEGVGQLARRHFGCPVRFNAERNALYFHRRFLDSPIEGSDTAYHAIIERYLTTTRTEASGSTRDAVYGEISRQMEFGACTLEDVAKKFRCEPRSLQRRLKDEGTSFRDLVDEWRKQRAHSLVTNTRLPLSEVSLAMGYADQSVFSRAFQRWYGETPLALRRKDKAHQTMS